MGLEGESFVLGKEEAWEWKKSVAPTPNKMGLGQEDDYDHFGTWHVHGYKGIAYEITKSQRGKTLILIDGYTYTQVSTHGWGCSTHKPQCKARLKVDPDSGHLAYVINDHCHPPREVFRKITGEVIMKTKRNGTKS